MNCRKIYTWIFLMLVIGTPLAAQQLPISFSKAFQDRQEIEPLKAAEIPAFDLAKVEREDEAFWGQNRFAAPLSVDLGLNNAGQWLDLENGDRLWRLQVSSKNGLGLILLYDNFYLPPGATLFVYRADKQQVWEPYTDRDNRADNKFVMGPISGESLILEYFEPAAFIGQGQIHLFRADHVYHQENLKTFEKKLSDFGFDSSLPCNQNINCPEGNTLQIEKRAVCRILMILEEGSGFCTGSLINNTELDGIPYILSAFHCQDGYTPMYDMWRFDFNYEALRCQTPGTEPIPVSMQGCVKRAGRQENDFLLLEATTSVPLQASHYFLGWNREETMPQSGSIIHHPSGDIKKVATDDDPAVINPRAIEWNNDVSTPASHHFILIYDQGTFELGSSGAALLDQDSRVVGQLHGGFNACSETTGYFGRLSLAWEGGGTPETRLKDWLDPGESGLITLDGMMSVQPSSGMLAGKVVMEDGRAVANAKVYLSGNNVSDSTITDGQGNYRFEGLPMLGGYGLFISKSEAANIGISAFDLILIQKHLLSSKPLDSMYKILAADVNQSNSISLVDIIKIRKVLLGSATDFGGTPIWQFIPNDFTFRDEQAPLSTAIPSLFYLMNFSNDVMNFDFIGYKTGDVNGSADPGN